MEMASAAGITLVPDDAKDPLLATSYGVGEMINHALKKGLPQFYHWNRRKRHQRRRHRYVKSSWRTFLDENDVDAGEGGQALAKVSRIDISGLNPLLREAHIQVACDVNNPLLR